MLKKRQFSQYAAVNGRRNTLQPQGTSIDHYYPQLIPLKTPAEYKVAHTDRSKSKTVRVQNETVKGYPGIRGYKPLYR